MEAASTIRTFLIADIRGYTRFTEEYGDEAAARLAAKFSDIVNETVQSRTGGVVEIRGDEALCVFDSARQAIRAAMDMQKVFADETNADVDLPLHVGVGIDSGEAIHMEDGSFRGRALNVAARLCALAHGGEVLVSESTTSLSGRLPGFRYVDRGVMALKGIEENVRAYRVAWEDEKEPASTFFFFGSNNRVGPKIIALAVLVAAATAIAVVWLTTGDSGEQGSAAPGVETTNGTPQNTGTNPGTGTEVEVDAPEQLDAIVPPRLWADCQMQTVPDEDALQTAVCLPAQNTGKPAPDRWQVSLYPDGKSVRHAYDELLADQGIESNSGSCSRTSWTGEMAWEHGPGQPGGRVFCYFNDDNDAVIVWRHERLGQATHRDILGIASEGGADHASLARWWSPRHHLIGKANG